jgi:acyl-CoA synthetase (AMP-forming)/AMP-acid ligase II
VLQFASYAFDLGRGDLPALAVGATLVLRHRGMRAPTPRSKASSTRTDHRADVRRLWRNGRAMRATGRPRHRRAPRDRRRREARAPRCATGAPRALRWCRWINAYGPTEATVHVRPSPSTAATPCRGRRAHRAADRQRASCDARRRTGPAPIGVTGEICIGGTGVARGYLNRPELSAGRFVADADGERLYAPAT